MNQYQVSYPPNALEAFGENTVRLHLNEAPYSPAPEVYEALQKIDLRKYPDAEYRELIHAIALFHGVEERHVTVGNGSHEIINLISLSTQHLEEVVLPSPTFYGHAKSVSMGGGTPVEVPVKDDGACNLAKMLDHINDYTSAVVIVTPNNPTGGANDKKELQDFLEEVPEHVLVVIDEAYSEFSIQSGGPDVLEILKEYSMPWLVMRTFSKAFALAGLRLGYGISNQRGLIEQLNFFRGTFRISGVASLLGKVALENHRYTEKNVAATIKSRNELRRKLIGLGYTVPKSFTNFLVLQNLSDPELVAERLNNAGVLVNIYHDAEGKKQLRITVGDQEQNMQLLDLLQEFSTDVNNIFKV